MESKDTLLFENDPFSTCEPLDLLDTNADSFDLENFKAIHGHLALFDSSLIESSNLPNMPFKIFDNNSRDISLMKAMLPNNMQTSPMSSSEFMNEVGGEELLGGEKCEDKNSIAKKKRGKRKMEEKEVDEVKEPPLKLPKKLAALEEKKRNGTITQEELKTLQKETKLIKNRER